MKKFHLAQETVRNYFKSNFHLYFSEIRLSQMDVENPVEFVGPGELVLDNGWLKFKVFHKNVGDESARHNANSRLGVAGQLVPADKYYSLNAVDARGVVWFSSSLDVSMEMSQEVSVLTARTMELKCEDVEVVGLESAVTYYVGDSLFTGRSGGLPTTGFEEDIGNGFKASVSPDYEFGVVSLTKEGVERSDGEALLRSLEIMIGKIIQLRCAEFVCDGRYWLELYSLDLGLPNEYVNPPVAINSTFQYESLVLLLKSLFDFMRAEGEEFHDYWLKIQRAWQTGIDNFALRTAVSIEGVLKQYFLQFGRDLVFKGIAAEAKASIAGLNLDVRVLDYLNNSLNGAGTFSARSALRELVKRKDIEPGMLKKWSELRNKSAHADKLDPKKTQELLDLTFTNLKLFYDLLVILIDYHGSKTDYSVRGFPSYVGRALKVSVP